MKFTIRAMKLEDLDAVHQIDVLSFSMPWSERSFRFELNGNPSSRQWVAEVQMEDDPPVIAGVLVIWLIVDEAHIGTIAVHPDYRQKGIGRRLLAEALLQMQREGAVEAFLEVRRSNLAAQEMYHAFGFEVVGVRPRYYRDNNEDALLFSLKGLDPEQLNRLREASSGV